jgi:DNA-binding GntR family transcriptional regulator
MTKSKHSGARLQSLVQQMRVDIRFGAFGFGDWLKLIDLQHRYDAKQIEIRSVLNELKVEGLVEHTANFGYRVGTPNPAEREQMRYVRTILERSAAPLIILNATDEAVAELTRLNEEFVISIELEGRQPQSEANSNFHRHLYALACNDVLITLIHDMRERSHYGTTGRWNDIDGLKASAIDHVQIIDAIAKRDPVELERVIVNHIHAF